MTAPIQTARFVCKAERVRELTDTLPHMARQSPFHVVKVIELTQAQYQHYAAHLGEKAPFITANRALMGTDAHGVIRCLLITVRSRRDGMLIDAQGYTRTSSSTPRESGSTGMMPERPSVLERLKGYRAQLDRKSAPTRQKTKNQHKTR